MLSKFEWPENIYCCITTYILYCIYMWKGLRCRVCYNIKSCIIQPLYCRRGGEWIMKFRTVNLFPMRGEEVEFLRRF